MACSMDCRALFESKRHSAGEPFACLSLSVANQVEHARGSYYAHHTLTILQDCIFLPDGR